MAIAETVFARASVLVLSHEVLFRRALALRNLIAILRRHVQEVLIVGYSRRQSAFVQSSYSQWLFRSPERTEEILRVVKGAGLDPVQFTGLERAFIAAVKTDMSAVRLLTGHTVMDWAEGYADLARQTEPLGAVISAGYVPRPEFGFSLLADFYRRCGYGVQDAGVLDAPPANVQFDEYLVEAVNLAIQAGLPMPGPHEHNAFFRDFVRTCAPEAQPEGELLGLLRAYVDTYHYASNREFCRAYDLDEAYFRPDMDVDRAQAEDAIAREAARRRADPGVTARRNAQVAGQLAALMFHHHNGRSRRS